MAVRRLIDPHRVRETFIIPLKKDGDTQSATKEWQRLYAEEPTWLDWALAQVRLPPTGDIFAV